MLGGAGKDTVTGGAGADFFTLGATTDSGITAATSDVFTDFQDGIDFISLNKIDANKTNGPGDDAFNFIGTNVAFGGNAGELRAYFTANGQIVEGNVNGDAKADFSETIFRQFFPIQSSIA